MDITFREIFTIINELKVIKTERQYLLTIEGYEYDRYNFINLALDKFTPDDLEKWLFGFLDTHDDIIVGINDNIVYELVDKYRKMISLDEYMKNNALVPLSYYDISIDYASICFIFKHTLYNTKHIYNINHVPYDNKDIYNKLNQHDKDMFNKISLFMNEFKGLQI